MVLSAYLETDPIYRRTGIDGDGYPELRDTKTVPAKIWQGPFDHSFTIRL